MYNEKTPIGIIMGSKADIQIMVKAAQILDSFNIKHDDQIISAHRTPDRLTWYAKYAEQKNFKVIIAGAGGAAHLPGMISSFTTIPVIGVPILVYTHTQNTKLNLRYSSFGGLDSLLSISEMPNGTSIVSVGINKSINAALYAIKILANEDKILKKKLLDHKKKQYEIVMKESKHMKKMGLNNFFDNDNSH